MPEMAVACLATGNTGQSCWLRSPPQMRAALLETYLTKQNSILAKINPILYGETYSYVFINIYDFSTFLRNFAENLFSSERQN